MPSKNHSPERASEFFDASWIATKAPTIDELAKLLNLTDTVSASWREGLEAVLGDYWHGPEDAQWSRVYLTPRLGSWRLAVGGWFGFREKKGGKDGFRPVARLCRKLSKRFGQAHAFTSQGRMDLYAWILAHDGQVTRELVSDGKVMTDRGTPLPIEVRLKKAWIKQLDEDAGELPLDWIGEEAVMAIAKDITRANDMLRQLVGNDSGNVNARRSAVIRRAVRNGCSLHGGRPRYEFFRPLFYLAQELRESTSWDWKHDIERLRERRITNRSLSI